MPRPPTSLPTQLASQACRFAYPRTIRSLPQKPLLSRPAKPTPPIHHATPTRPFSSSPSRLKKGGKANTAHARSDSSPPVKNAGTTPTDEAYDMSTLETSILKAMEKLTHDLSQLRSGGRFNPDVVEGLRVLLGKGSGGKESVRLSEVAQVVPRGRVVNVIVGEKEHIKPVSTSISSSPHNLVPQPPHSSTPLTIPVLVPPPTGESRKAALEAAHKASEHADTAIKNARAAHHKRLRKFQLEKEVLPDDLQKATKRMEEVVKKGYAEVKRITEGAKRVLESG